MLTWKKCLPPQFQLLPDIVHARLTQDQLTPLMMLHVRYEQCISSLPHRHARLPRNLARLHLVASAGGLGRATPAGLRTARYQHSFRL